MVKVDEECTVTAGAIFNMNRIGGLTIRPMQIQDEQIQRVVAQEVAKAMEAFKIDFARSIRRVVTRRSRDMW